jgi:hypothetical protein
MNGRHIPEKSGIGRMKKIPQVSWKEREEEITADNLVG